VRRLRVQLTVLLALLGIPTGLPVVWAIPTRSSRY
jgi:hypothetical protein